MIVKMSGWVSPPQPQDYDAIIGNISALNRAVFGQRVIITEYNSLLLPRLSLGSVIQHGGVLYVVQDEEYEISGSVSQGANYIRVSASGDTLAVEWVTSRNGYSWNPVYGYLADGSGRQLLPYKVVRSGDNYEKSHLSELSVAVMGNLKAESIDTGDGPVKLNQNLRTTDNPTFAKINAGTITASGLLYPSNYLTAGSSAIVSRVGPINGKSTRPYEMFKATLKPTFSGSFKMSAELKGYYYSSTHYAYPTMNIKKNNNVVYTQKQTGTSYALREYTVTFEAGDYIVFEILSEDFGGGSGASSAEAKNIVVGANRSLNNSNLLDVFFSKNITVTTN